MVLHMGCISFALHMVCMYWYGIRWFFDNRVCVCATLEVEFKEKPTLSCFSQDQKMGSMYKKRMRIRHI